MKTRFYRKDKSYYENEVEKTKYYCPGCGKKKVYEEVGDGDFYEGTTLYCNNCNNSFTMPSMGIDKTINWINE